MTKRSLPTPEELRQLLRYEPETGKLYWKPRPAIMFDEIRHCNIWNARYANKEAFTSVKGSGYRHGRVNYKPLLAHRVIWAMVHSRWPEAQIDHVDNDRLNNRIGNLRESTHAENMRNQCNRKTNKSGYKGVHWDSRDKAFRAQISYEGKKIFLGYHATAEAAHAAYCEAAKKYHGEFARTE